MNSKLNRRAPLVLALAVVACLVAVKGGHEWGTKDQVPGSSHVDSAESLEALPSAPGTESGAASAGVELAQQDAMSLGERRAIDPELGGDRVALPLVVGRVVDLEGEGIAGARVLLTNEYSPPVPLEAVNELGRRPYPMVEVATDGRGKFTVTAGLEPRRGLSLIVQSSGYETYRINGEWMYPGRTVSLGEIRMQRGATLSGRVVNASGGGVQAQLVRRIAIDWRNVAWGGGPVGWYGGATVLGESDEGGRFVLDGLPPGRWTIAALANGWMPEEASVVLEQGGTESVELVVQEGAQIRGRVAQLPHDEVGLRAFARPARNVDTVEPRTTSIRSDGRFELGGLVFGEAYEVGVFRPGASPSEVPEVLPIEATAGGEDAPVLSLAWRVLSGLELLLVEGETGDPVEQADVLWARGEHVGQSLERTHFPGGRVVVDGGWLPLQPKTELRVRSAGFVDWVSRAENLRQRGASQPVTVELERGPAVTVQVSDSTGRPVGGAEIFLGSGGRRELDQRSETAHLETRSWRTRRALTGADGRAVLSTLVSGKERPVKGTIAVFADGYAPGWVEVAAGPGAVEVTLFRGATLLVRAKDATGQSLDGVIVVLQRFDGSGWPMKAGSTVDGVVAFENLLPGTHRYRARLGRNAQRLPGYNGQEAWIPVDLQDGETKESPLVCQGFYDFTGQIADQHGPLAGAQMVLFAGDRTRGEYQQDESFSGRGSRFHVLSRIDGSFRFHVIPEGQYTLLVEHKRLTLAARMLVAVARGGKPLTLQLATTTVEGTVTFPGNEPVANAVVGLSEVGGPSFGSTYTDERGRFVITGAPSDRGLNLRVGGRFVDHLSMPLSPLLPGEVRRVDVVGEARGAVRFTLVGGQPDSLRVKGQSADGLHKATMVQPSDAENLIETSGLVPGPWVFQLEGLQTDGVKVEEERRVEVVVSKILETTLTLK